MRKVVMAFDIYLLGMLSTALLVKGYVAWSYVVSFIAGILIRIWFYEPK